MLKFKKVTMLILSIVFTVSLTACGDTQVSTDSGDEPIVVNLWHQWTNETDAMRIALDDAAESYMAEHQDIKIVTNMLENEAYKTKISTEFAGSAKGIDLFFYWGGGRGGKLANADKLLPVEEYLSDDIRSKIKPGSTSQFEYEGTLYALPTYAWMMLLYCNKDMFDEAGIALPETYEDWLDACAKFREKGIEVPVAQGIKESWQAAFVYEALALREVGSQKILDMFAGKTGMEDAGYLSAAEKTSELAAAGAFGDNPLEIATGDADVMFLTGKSPMRLQGNWFSEMVTMDKNSTIQEANIVPLNIPMSGSVSNETDYCGGYIDSFFINKNTENPDEVVDFYIYLCEELARARQESGQGFSGFTTPVDDSKLPPVSKMASELANETENGVVAWDTALDEEKAAVHLDEVQTLFLPGADPEAVIEEHKKVISGE